MERLTILAAEAAGCARCPLHVERIKSVFARGNQEAPLMLIGEAPGEEENKSGSPFVGAAGRLLNEALAEVGFSEQSVYICNVVKCRPPRNRIPFPEEIQACSHFLSEQIRLVKPKIILPLGKTATETLLQAKISTMGKIRGREIIIPILWIPSIPTYHPSYYLHGNQNEKVKLVEDLSKAYKFLLRQNIVPVGPVSRIAESLLLEAALEIE